MKAENVLIPVNEKLEIRALLTRIEPESPLAIWVPPDPMFGGTMRDPVMETLHEWSVYAGFNTLRFDFVPMDRDEREKLNWQDSRFEVGDAAVVLEWAQDVFDQRAGMFVGGYSFGAGVALELSVRRPIIDRFVAVSPLLTRYDFSFLDPCPVSGAFVFGDEDDTKPQEAKEELEPLLNQTHVDIQHYTVDRADHYYKTAHSRLGATVSKYMSDEVDKGGFDESRYWRPVAEADTDGSEGEPHYISA